MKIAICKMVSKRNVILLLLLIVLFISNLNSQAIFHDEKYNDSFLQQQIVNQNEKEIKNPSIHEKVSFRDDKNYKLKVASEQEVLDTMRKALLNLPTIEIEKIGMDFNEPILDGTERAKQMRAAWIERQEDIKLAMSTIVKPAEHMAKLAATIKNTSSSVNQVTQALIELEANLLDIDNAKDFHTIGGWPILVDVLDVNNDRYTLEHRAYAAWSVGTAVKNSYDYQLWILEKSKLNENDSNIENSSALEKLVNLLEHDSDDVDQKIRRYVLYAISSASRGNADVQAALLDIQIPNNNETLNLENNSLFLKYMRELVLETQIHPIITRKIWALVSDMLEEREYIRGEFISELGDDVPIDVIEQINSIKLLGDEFCSEFWRNSASNAMERILGDSDLINNVNFIYNNIIKDMDEMDIIVNDNSDSNDEDYRIKPMPESYIQAVPIRAALHSLVEIMGKLTHQCDGTIWSDNNVKIKKYLLMISNFKGEENEDLIRNSVKLLNVFYKL